MQPFPLRAMHKILLVSICLLAVVLLAWKPFVPEVKAAEDLDPQLSQSELPPHPPTEEWQHFYQPTPVGTGLRRVVVETEEAVRSLSPNQGSSRIVGVLTSPDGSPLARARFLARLERTKDDGQSWHNLRGELSRRIETDSRGRFTLDRKSVDHRYRVEQLTTPFEENGWFYLNEPVFIPADQDEVALETHGGVGIAGQVLGIEGLPCTLKVTSADRRTRRVSIDPNTGAYEMHGLSPGVAKVLVIPDSGLKPIHVIHDVWFQLSSPQDPRLATIHVSHQFRTIEVRVAPPLDRFPPSVMFRTYDTQYWRRAPSHEDPGVARIVTDSPTVDLMVSAPGSCWSYLPGVGHSIAVQLDPIIPVELRVEGSPGHDSQMVVAVRLTCEASGSDSLGFVQELWRDEQNPHLWTGELLRPGLWEVEWQVVRTSELIDGTPETEDGDWSRPPGLSEPIVAGLNHPVRLRTQFPDGR